MTDTNIEQATQDSADTQGDEAVLETKPARTTQKRKGTTSTVEIPRDAMVPAAQLEELQYKLQQLTESLAEEKKAKQNLRLEKSAAEDRAKRVAIESALRGAASEVAILPAAFDDNLPNLMEQFSVGQDGKVYPKDNPGGDYKSAFREWVDKRPYVKGVSVPASTGLSQVNLPFTPSNSQTARPASLDLDNLQRWIRTTPGSIENKKY